MRKNRLGSSIRASAMSIVREAIEYNYWARDLQLGVCTSLTNEQFVRPLGSSFSSLRDTLAHLLGTEWVYLERLRGRSPNLAQSGAYASETFPDISTIRSRWRSVERDLREYLTKLPEENLWQDFSYKNLKGEQWTYPLWRILFHLINHQTYHRGQIATMLRQIGVQPPQIDFLVAHDQWLESQREGK